MGTLGDFHLPFAGNRLGLVGVVVDTADDQRRAVATGQRNHALESLFPVLQVDGVDD